MHTQAEPSVELYTFSAAHAGAPPQRLTPHEFDVALGGEVFVSTALRRQALALGAEAAKNTLELELPPDADLVQALLHSAVLGTHWAVRLQAARYDAAAQRWMSSGTRFLGRVLHVELGDTGARLRCESAQVSLQRIGLRRLYSRACSHVLYSSACGALMQPRAAVTGPIQDSELNARSLLDPHTLETIDPSGLAGGWLETPSGVRHMIESTDGPAVVLLRRVLLPEGLAVQAVSGCDRSPAVCAQRYHNLDNYGGFPALPRQNPFNSAIY